MRDEAAPDTPAVQEFGHAGWLGLLLAATFLIIRLLKTDRLDLMLSKFGIPPVPKKLLPWLALILPAGAAFLEAILRSNMGWQQALIAAGWGVFAGSGSVALNETLPSVTRPASAPVSNIVFGPNAGPNPGPAAPNPSIRPGPGPDGPTGGAGGSTADGGATGTTPVPGLQRRLLAPLLALLVAVGSLGCAAILAALPTVIAAVQSAMLVLDQLEQFIDAAFRAKPNPELEKQVGKSLAKTRSALLLVQHAAEGATDLHDQRLQAAFASFEAAYSELLSLVHPLGVRVAPLPLGGAADAPLQVAYDAASETLTVPPAEAFRPKEVGR